MGRSKACRRSLCDPDVGVASRQPQVVVPLMLGPLFRHPRRTPTCGVLALLIALASARAGTEVSRSQPTEPAPAPAPAAWRPGRLAPIGVEKGRARFEVPTPEPGSRTLVIVSALSKEPGPFSIRLSARSALHANPPVVAAGEPVRAPVLPPARLAPIPAPVTGLPPRERTFHLMT